MKVTGKVINNIPCLTYRRDGYRYAISMKDGGLVAVLKDTNVVTGKVINGIPCLVYTKNGVHKAVAIKNNVLVATW